ncbi:UNVERIFIED_CONTAM: Periplasmic protease [Acetivibrio alkalicellulosi]
MFFKNNVQKNFKREMKILEKDLLEKEKQEKGAFSNTYFKNSFLGSDSSHGKIKKVLAFTLHRWYVVLLVCFILFAIIYPYPSMYKVYNSFENGEYEKTIEYCQKILRRDEYNYEALTYKGVSHRNLMNYQEAIEIFLLANERYPRDVFILNELGYAYHFLSEYYESLKYYDEVIGIDPKNLEAHVWKGYTLLELYEYDKAIETADNYLAINDNNLEGYNLKGKAYLYQEKYDDAIKYFQKAINSHWDDYDVYEDAHTNIIYALFIQNSLQECIEFSESIIDEFPKLAYIPYYIGECYYVMGEYETAIEYYTKANEIDDDNQFAFVDIGWSYFQLQEYDKALIYANKALDVNSYDFSAQSLSHELEIANLPEPERIVNFVRENYLYLDQVEDFDIKADVLLSKSEIDYDDIENFIDSIRVEDDFFTYYFHSSEYEEYEESNLWEDVEYLQVEENIHYVYFDIFTPGVSNNFKQILQDIPSNDENYLILDLRYNGGGHLSSARDMLDLLLPQCISFYTIDRQGYLYALESTELHFKFKHIFILVSEYTASCAETMALSLRTYLDNVTIIGSNTSGKRVTQDLFDNKKKKYVIYLVNSYWNVRENNVYDKYIKPDIMVKGTSIDDYINAIILE